jgi:biotin transporter BioY
MKCMPINNITFDHDSLEAIREIRKKRQLLATLAIVMPVGTMANIFLGNGVLKSSYNITQTDFATLAKAVHGLPAIQRKIIRDIAAMQALSHFGKESMFWRGIADGCSIQ